MVRIDIICPETLVSAMPAPPLVLRSLLLDRLPWWMADAVSFDSDLCSENAAEPCNEICHSQEHDQVPHNLQVDLLLAVCSGASV